MSSNRYSMYTICTSFLKRHTNKICCDVRQRNSPFVPLVKAKHQMGDLSRAPLSTIRNLSYIVARCTRVNCSAAVRVPSSCMSCRPALPRPVDIIVNILFLIVAYNTPPYTSLFATPLTWFRSHHVVEPVLLHHALLALNMLPLISNSSE